MDDYWIDKYEVSNRQFRDFVRANGYSDPRFWKHEFIQGGRKLSFGEAMKLLLRSHRSARAGHLGIGGFSRR